ncbi:MAG: GAF domain-containing sensor histidine kinase [Labilithrix sp.]
MTEERGKKNLSIYEQTRLGLARLGLGAATDLSRGLERAMEASAQTLEVARAGVWFWANHGTELHCATLYDARAQKHEAGAILEMLPLPAYAKALFERRVIVASDARSAPETSELRDHYLDPNGITSMLDAPIFRGGAVVGVVCLEHVGPARVWQDRERDFAASLADLVAVLLEQATRLEAEASVAALRERAAKAERVEALSRLGAGLAHDFNNVVSSMLLRAELIRSRHVNDAELLRDIDAIIEDGRFGARLVRELLLFAKRERPRSVDLDLAEAVETALPRLATAAQTAKVTLVPPVQRPLMVHVDPTHIEQVLVNLVANASEAGGQNVAISVAEQDNRVVLRVKDDGAGMDVDTLEHAFEPFFTTKGTGSGIGLSAVKSIVEQSGGDVRAESTESRGSTFIVRLPLVR